MTIEIVDGPALKLLGLVELEERFWTRILLLVKSPGLPGKAKHPARLWWERIGIGAHIPHGDVVANRGRREDPGGRLPSSHPSPL